MYASVQTEPRGRLETLLVERRERLSAVVLETRRQRAVRLAWLRDVVRHTTPTPPTPFRFA